LIIHSNPDRDANVRGLAVVYLKSTPDSIHAGQESAAGCESDRTQLAFKVTCFQKAFENCFYILEAHARATARNTP
jgi:hypothetical protein